MNFTVRPATDDDASFIFDVMSQAVEYFARNGIDQWQNNYPSHQDIQQDIRQGQAYILAEQNHPIATAALCFGDEPDYQNILEGAWQDAGPYAAIHRVAVESGAKGKGIASVLMQRLIQIAREKGMRSVRIDTHQDNRSMQRMLEKNGFIHRGKILLTSHDNTERMMYELIF